MNHTNIAIPYYGKLSHPSQGFEHVYFILEKTESGKQPEQVNIGVWDSKEAPDLSDWFKQNNVKSVICLDRPNRSIREHMGQNDIWIEGNTSIEAQIYLETVQVR